MKNARGFTLIEMLITIVLIGIVSIIVSPLLNEITSSQITAYRAYQQMMNRRIGDAFLTYARTSSATGALPSPVSNGTDTFSAPTDLTASSTLNTILQMAGVPGTEVNEDGRAAHNARVYQVVQNMPLTVPLDVQSGPQVNLLYQYGVVYSTTCPKSDTSCNKAAVPGASVVLDSTNSGSWKPTSPDFGMASFSSLPVQMDMVAKTKIQAFKIREAFVTYFRQQQAAAPGSTANFYPNNGGSTSVPSASANQGCWYPWVNLSTTPVLAVVGLSQAEYGNTAWGGRFEYCRDYDSQGTASADAAPHYGAIRFHRDVSTGPIPATTASRNVFLTF